MFFLYFFLQAFQKRLFRLYFDYSSSFKELLERDNSFTIHHKNVQSLAIEIYKFVNGLSPDIMSKVFQKNENNHYNLRCNNDFYSDNPKTVRYGTESISYLAPKIWSLIPNDIKSSLTLSVFKSKIRKWTPNFPCRLCKNYVQYVGFV